MNHATIINLAIILLIAVGIAFTKNPMFLLGLLMLVEMPFGLVQNQQSIDAAAAGVGADDDEGEPAIGFTASIK